MELNQSFATYRQFLKSNKWQSYSKSSDNLTRLFTRVSDRNLLCLKSISHCRAEVDSLIDALGDLKLKPKYDDTVESAHFIYENLPYDSVVFYQKHKKILVVSPRDLVCIAKTYRVSKDEVYILARAIDLPSVPPQKNIVRADTPISGWRLKVK